MLSNCRKGANFRHSSNYWISRKVQVGLQISDHYWAFWGTANPGVTSLLTPVCVLLFVGVSESECEGSPLKFQRNNHTNDHRFRYQYFLLFKNIVLKASEWTFNVFPPWLQKWWKIKWESGFILKFWSLALFTSVMSWELGFNVPRHSHLWSIYCIWFLGYHRGLTKPLNVLWWHSSDVEGMGD